MEATWKETDWALVDRRNGQAGHPVPAHLELFYDDNMTTMAMSTLTEHTEMSMEVVAPTEGDGDGLGAAGESITMASGNSHKTYEMETGSGHGDQMLDD